MTFRNEPATISLKSICFDYSGVQILNNLNLEIEKRDRIGLLGPNGCGKTTLSHIIMGLLTPVSGTIEIFGKRMESEKDFCSVRGKIGFMFQDSDDQLFCPTVIEDVAFGPLNLGQSPEQARQTDRKSVV